MLPAALHLPTRGARKMALRDANQTGASAVHPGFRHHGGRGTAIFSNVLVVSLTEA